MRQPKPWFWKARNAWYVTLRGKQIKLGATEKEAYQTFYGLMAEEGRLTPKQSSRITVADACNAIVGANAHAKPSTRRLYRDMLGPFAAAFKTRLLASMTADEVIRFVRSYQGTGYKGKLFGDSTRALMFRYIKTMFRWARETGIIQVNPLAGTRNPWKIRARTELLTEEDYLKIQGDRKLNDRAKEAIEVMYRTGMRPGEAVVMSARHLDARLPIARFQPTEHKTGTKTGLQREVYFPPDLMERMRKYAEIRPRGPLLRNKKGEPWTVDSISSAFKRSKRRLGLDGELVLYTTRHGFITKLLEQGSPLARVTKSAGHANPDAIMRFYYHPDTHAMLEDVAKASEGLADKVAEIRERIRQEGEPSNSVAPTDVDADHPTHGEDGQSIVTC